MLLAGTCGVFSYIDRSGPWYWEPSPALFTMLDSAMQPTGRLTGRLLAVGGPPGAAPRPLPGQVTVGSRLSIPLPIGDDGRFAASLAPGRYRIVGYSPLYNDGKAPCMPLHPFVTVRAGQTVRVQVLCQEK